MCNEAVHISPAAFCISDPFKSQEMYQRVFEENPYMLEVVPDHFKTQGMCERTVKKDQRLLEFVLITSRRKKCVMVW